MRVPATESPIEDLSTATPASGVRPRATRARRTALLALATLLALTTLAGCNLSEEEFLIGSATNSERHARGLPALGVDDQLTAKAQEWAGWMAATGQMAHSNLTDGVTGWRLLGENVGRGPTLQSVQDAFMASPSHRATLLDGRYRWFGIGVARSADGQYWVAIVFKA